MGRNFIVAAGRQGHWKSVQDLLGHATASFTLNVYAHTSEQMMKDTTARMQSYYDGLAVKGLKQAVKGKLKGIVLKMGSKKAL